MKPEDIDFSPLSRALAAFEEAIVATRTPQTPSLHRLMRDAAIKRFEFCIKLSWKMLRRVLVAQGHRELGASPRGIFRLGHQEGLIAAVKPWFDFLEAGNGTIHVYDEQRIEQLVVAVESFAPFAADLLERLQRLCHEA